LKHLEAPIGSDHLGSDGINTTDGRMAEKKDFTEEELCF